MVLEERVVDIASNNVGGGGIGDRRIERFGCLAEGRIQDLPAAIPGWIGIVAAACQGKRNGNRLDQCEPHGCQLTSAGQTWPFVRNRAGRPAPSAVEREWPLRWVRCPSRDGRVERGGRPHRPAHG